MQVGIGHRKDAENEEYEDGNGEAAQVGSGVLCAHDTKTIIRLVDYVN